MYFAKRILLLCFFISLRQFAQSEGLLNTEDFAIGAVSMEEYHSAPLRFKEEIKNLKKEEKRIARTEKFRTKIEKVLQSKRAIRSLGNISDPVDKWFWIWVISWGVGILITLSAGAAIGVTAVGIIWLLAFSVGAASLIAWLIKKFR